MDLTSQPTGHIRIVRAGLKPALTAYASCLLHDLAAAEVVSA